MLLEREGKWRKTKCNVVRVEVQCRLLYSVYMDYDTLATVAVNFYYLVDKQ